MQEYYLKKRLKSLKWTNRKLRLIPMTTMRIAISRLPNPMKKVILGNYTFPLDSGIFADIINEKSQEYPAFYNVSDLKRVNSAIYDSNNNTYIAQYHEKVAVHQQNLFIEQQKNYYTDWLKSLGNSRAKETIELLNAIFQSEKKDQLNCQQYKAIVPKTSEKRIMIKTIDEKYLDFIKSQAYMYRFHKIGDNKSDEDAG